MKFIESITRMLGFEKPKKNPELEGITTSENVMPSGIENTPEESKIKFDDEPTGRIGYRIFKQYKDRDPQDPRDATCDRHYGDKQSEICYLI